MTRFESLKHAPAETRKTLRDRFSRFLLTRKQQYLLAEPEQVFNDEVVLKLLQRLVISSLDNPAFATPFYEKAREHVENAPSLEQLCEQGWIIHGWKRLSVPFEVARVATAEVLVPFCSWMEVRFDSTYQIREKDETDTQFSELAESVVDGTRRAIDIACSSPSWVASRLWDRDERGAAASSESLYAWLQAWELLQRPEIVPSRTWREESYGKFISSTFAVMEEEIKFSSWEQYRQKILLRLARTHGGEIERFESYLPPIPSTIVGKAIWLSDHEIERHRYEELSAWEHAAGLIRLILNDVEHSENATSPHPHADRILELAIKHPEVLSTILFRASTSPTVLVELLLKAETSALACLLISQWNLNSGAWDKTLTMRDNDAARTTTFIDAISVMAYYVRENRIAPAEIAALILQMHTQFRPSDAGEVPNGDAMLVALKEELSGFSQVTLTAIFDALTNSDYELVPGLPAFSAALEVLDAGQFTEGIAPAPLVQAYIQAIQTKNFMMSAARISPDNAAALFAMSQQLDDGAQQIFLSPIDTKAQLASIGPDDNPYTVRDQLARALRTHIRVISRAIIGQIGAVPAVLVDALRKAIFFAAFAHEEKGRVAAFAAHHDRSPTGITHERGLAADVGRALTLLALEDAQSVLKEILTTDEPAFLAQLLRNIPRTMQARIEERIAELVPDNAGNPMYFTDLHHRIDELLSAGAYKTAKIYIDAFPTPPDALKAQFSLIHLQQRLRLALATKDWETLKAAAVPEDISHANVHAAQDTVDFYRAVSELNKDGGNLELAEQHFTTLHRKHPGVTEYWLNLFATKLARLISHAPFAQLDGTRLAFGKKLLAEVLQEELRYSLSPANAEGHLTNKAVLLLAIGQPKRADEILHSILIERPSESVAAYSAVALARIGKKEEAIAALERAEEIIGHSDVIDQAKSYLNGGAGTSISVQIAEAEPRFASVKEALLAMHMMNPDEQAELWSEPPGLVPFVIDQVRYAAASVVTLVSIMRNVTLDSCEDDINAVIRQLLTSRLAFLKWSVPDQSKGGFTGKGNPGERDVLIQKDTSELAVIEAVICRSPASTQTTQKDLTNHFQKLLGYSTSKLFFHLTYAYLSDITSIVTFLKDVAGNKAPEKFDYLGMEDLPSIGSCPTGFKARYHTQDGEIAVVFLVLNLSQDSQRQAAVKARETKTWAKDA